MPARRSRQSAGSALLLCCLAASAAAQDLALEVSPYPGFARASRVTAIAETTTGRLFVAANSGLQAHDGRAVADIALDLLPDGQPATNLRILAAGSDGQMWIGGDGGVWCIDAQQRVGRHLAGTESLRVMGLVSTPDALWIRALEGLFARRGDGALLRAPLPPPPVTVTGLAASIGHVWTWNSQGLWTVRLAGDTVALDPVACAYAKEIRAGNGSGRDLLTVSPRGVRRLTPEGEDTPLAPADGLGFPTRIVVTADRVWIAGNSHVAAMSPSGGLVRPCRFFAHGSALAFRGVSALEVDGEGILWLGTQNGLQRALVPPAVQSVLVNSMHAGEVVTALLPAAVHGLLLGTNEGRLLRDAGAEFTPVELPWSCASAGPPPRIDALLQLGPLLWLGTDKLGLWQRSSTGWHRVGEAAGIQSVRDLAQAPDGRLWVADRSGVFAGGQDGDWQRLACTDSSSSSALPCRLLCQPDGEVWLGTNRGGLQRLAAAAGRFVLHAADWGNGSVTALRGSDGGDRLWCTTLDGLFEVTATTAQPLHHTSRNGAFRNLEVAADGRLWASDPTELHWFDPQTGWRDVVGPSQGAHPLGYRMFGSCRLADGDLVFGAIGGYTRIDPVAFAAAPTATRIADVRVHLAGRRLPPFVALPFNLSTTLDEQPIGIDVAVIDRAVDVARAPVLSLRGPDGSIDRCPAADNLGTLRPGDYEVLVQPRGEAAPPQLVARLHVANAPPYAALLALAATALLALLGFAIRRRRRATTDWQSLLQQLGPLPDAAAAIDIAFMAVATMEQGAAITRPVYACAWLGTAGNRVMVGEHGRRPLDAEDRFRRCRASGVELHASTWLLLGGSKPDVAMTFADAGTLQVEILLHDLAKVADAPMERLRAATAPLLAALHKHVQLDRARRELADKSLTLHEEVHDLRNPLTVLSIHARNLQQQLERAADPAVRESLRHITAATHAVAHGFTDMVQRFESPGRLVHCGAGDALSLLHERLQRGECRAREKRIDIVLQAPPATAPVHFDPAWLARAFDNVLGNAIKFSPPGSTVGVEVEDDAEQLQITVRDQGPGFCTAELAQLLLPGATGSARPTAGETQSGLGLWIARQAMLAMGGQLQILADATPGACVRLCLARDAAQQAS